MDFQTKGIEFAIENLKANNPAGWQSGAEFDHIGRGMGATFFQAREQFYAGVQQIDGLSQEVKQAIRDQLHSQIDWLWSQGQIPAWLFPHVREMGALTMTVATSEGGLIEGAHRVERGS